MVFPSSQVSLCVCVCECVLVVDCDSLLCTVCVFVLFLSSHWCLSFNFFCPCIIFLKPFAEKWEFMQSMAGFLNMVCVVAIDVETVDAAVATVASYSNVPVDPPNCNG